MSAFSEVLGISSPDDLVAAFRIDALRSRRAGLLDNARVMEECALAVLDGNRVPLRTSMRGLERDVTRWSWLRWP